MEVYGNVMFVNFSLAPDCSYSMQKLVEVNS